VQQIPYEGRTAAVRPADEHWLFRERKARCSLRLLQRIRPAFAGTIPDYLAPSGGGFRQGRVWLIFNLGQGAVESLFQFLHRVPIASCLPPRFRRGRTTIDHERQRVGALLAAPWSP